MRNFNCVVLLGEGSNLSTHHSGKAAQLRLQKEPSMADWFKFYDNDLDDTRLQYAISKLPEVVSVYVGILSECSRHKSATIRWGDNAIELFGFSRRLGISVPKVNEAVNILKEIDYITHSNGHISVTDWDSKQSEYCQRKAAKKASVPIVSRHSPMRGEEIRVEKKEGKEPEAPILKTNGAQTIEWGREHARIIESLKSLRASYSEHQSWSSEDLERKRLLILRRDELKDLLLIKY